MSTDPPRPLLYTPPHLLREIIDHILSTLISLHAHDPAYQWTHFRSLTRFHRKQLDDHFLHLWLPKLTLTLYGGSPDTYVEYYAYGHRKKTGKARYKIKRCDGEALFPGYISTLSSEGTSGLSSEWRGWWHDHALRTTYPFGDERRRGKDLILRLGEGILNQGFTGGGMLSDMQLPELKVGPEAEELWFDWRAAFSTLFGEEMVMRRFGKELLRRFDETTKGKVERVCRGKRGFMRS